MSITVRPLQASDREEWNPLWQGYLAFYETELPDDMTEHTWSRLISDDPELMGIAALDKEGHVIGIAHYFFHQSTWSKGGYCYLEDLFVDPRIRGGGTGEALVKTVETQAKLNGCTLLYWVTQHENFRARGLYNRLAGSSTAVKYEIDL